MACRHLTTSWCRRAPCLPVSAGHKVVLHTHVADAGGRSGAPEGQYAKPSSWGEYSMREKTERLQCPAGGCLPQGLGGDPERRQAIAKPVFRISTCSATRCFRIFMYGNLEIVKGECRGGHSTSARQATEAIEISDAEAVLQAPPEMSLPPRKQPSQENGGEGCAGVGVLSGGRLSP